MELEGAEWEKASFGRRLAKFSCLVYSKFNHWRPVPALFEKLRAYMIRDSR